MEIAGKQTRVKICIFNSHVELRVPEGGKFHDKSYGRFETNLVFTWMKKSRFTSTLYR